MKHLIIVIALVTTTSIALADNSSFCSSSTGVSQIADYLRCQSQPGLATCAALGTALTGAVVTTAAKMRLKTAAQIHEKWRLSRKFTLSQAEKELARLKVEADAAERAAGKFEQTSYPHEMHKLEDLIAEFKAGKIKEIYNPYFRSDVEFWGKPGSPGYSRLTKGWIDVANPKFSELPGGVQTEMAQAVSENQALYRPVSVALRALGARGSLLLGGVVGVAVYATSEVLSASPTACDEIADSYINREANGSLSKSCQPVYEVNRNVANFLDLPATRQVALMKNPKVCDFYQKLHDKILARPNFQSLTCEEGGFAAELKSPNGDKYTVKAHTFGQNYIKQVNYSGTMAGGLIGGVFQFDSTGNPTLGLSQSTNDVYRQMKLYITEAGDCCSSNDADESACLKKFNPGMGKPRKSAAPSSGVH